MKRFILAAGVAALAISAPAAAERGGQRGDHKSNVSAKADRGGASKARTAKTDRKIAGQRLASVDRKAERKSDRARITAREHAVKRADARNFDRKEARAIAKIRDKEARIFRKDAENVVRLRNRGEDARIRNWDDDRPFANARGRGLIDGCPPGLFKKNPPCIPPGLAKNAIGQRLANNYRYSALPLALRDLYRDDDDYYYRYGNNGYLYRVDRDTQLVNALLPLFGAGLGLGQTFPSTFGNAYVPSYYQPFYPDSRDNYYRYANGYVYGVDRDSGLIESMIPLMAGGYGVGQMLPAGYSAYNVPYEYRDLYYDTDDSYYRYAPGAIYQVDPQTQLITSVASLLSPNGFAVGQPLPMGYTAYNVPYGYRDQYYDTADNWYRYNNGNIYQVDPTTQLITAIVRAIV
jgi:hypothetical protein